MPEYYLIIVVLLFGLAISDLVVGVSNDAVNFLNSSIGSKVAPRKTIMIVASLGILVGALFSSGMMEVARKGIFNPELFYFSEIMVVFIAVMLTDIILLDLFNTYGMPTSTTVSIVFELLGAAVAVAVLKITALSESLATLPDYINGSSAILIISGIFLSVFIAFFVGTFIQYFSRILFTFHYKRKLSTVGIIYSGLALSALTFFLLIKGAKGASFLTDDVMTWINEYRIILFISAVVFWSILMLIIHKTLKFDILRIVVLFGTFSLAMAFSGNDLVNFIGVPIAGFESYLSWSTSSTPAEEFAMSSLNQPVRTKTYLLFIAAVIMIITLWLSKKARTVTETEVNLGRQDEGAERFSPNFLSKFIVRYSIALSSGFEKITPKSWKKKSKSSFKPNKNLEEDTAAFDLVRASSNLTVASILIAIATSFKLPLSTTYVSFMVAMGTSLADKAWGRNSAVYRVAGVINVIGGWFFTAIIAFVVSALFATLIYFFKIWGIVILVLTVIGLVSRTFFLHKKKETESKKLLDTVKSTKMTTKEEIIDHTSQKLKITLSSVRKAFKNGITNLFEENLDAIYAEKKALETLSKENKEFKHHLVSLIKKIDSSKSKLNITYLSIYEFEKEILNSALSIINSCYQYVDHSFTPLEEDQRQTLLKTISSIDSYLEEVILTVDQKKFGELNTILQKKLICLTELEDYLNHEIEAIKDHDLGQKNSLLIFDIALEAKDMIALAARFIKTYNRI